MTQIQINEIWDQIGTREDKARRRRLIQMRKSGKSVLNGHVALLPESEAMPIQKRTLKRVARSRILKVAIALKEPMTTKEFAAREGISHGYAEKILKKAGRFKDARYRAGQSPAEIHAFQMPTKMTVKEFAKMHKLSEAHARRLLDRYGKCLFEPRHRCSTSGTFVAKHLKEPMTAKEFSKKYGFSDSYSRRVLKAAKMCKGAK